MILSEFVEHYQTTTGYRGKSNSNGWQIRCIAHDDNRASLSISSNKGKILLRCHAGCDNDIIVAKLGLKMSDLFEESGNKEFRILKTYDYTDENGDFLYQVVKTNRAKGIPRRKDVDGTWVWSLTEGLHHYLYDSWQKVKSGQTPQAKTKHFGNARRVLYNLPALLKNKFEPVFLMAGEKDAENAIKQGLVATTNVGGESNWDESYNVAFKDKRVVIVIDSDPTGRMRGTNLKNVLSKVASSVQVIDFNNPLKGYDFSNWIEEHNVEELFDIVFGTTVPNSRTLESACIAAIFKKPVLLNNILERDAIKTFYFHKNKLILEAMKSVGTIDVATVGEALGKHLITVGGLEFLEDFLTQGKELESLHPYLDLIEKTYQARELLKVANGVVAQINNGRDIESVKNRLSAQLNLSLNYKEQAEDASSVLAKFLQNWKQSEVGVLTGLLEFDLFTNGLQKKKLIILAGRSGMGKSAMALTMAHNASKTGKNVLYISAEMDKDELSMRQASMLSRVPLSNIIKTNMTRDETLRMFSIEDKVSKSLVFDVCSSPTTEMIRAKALAHISKTGKLDLLIVDHLHRMKGKSGKPRHEQLEEICVEMSDLAKELDVPLVLLSQINREGDGGSGGVIIKKPTLVDLKGSGGIEENADIVILIHRDEYYNPLPENMGLADMIIAKGRSIGTRKIKLAFLSEYTMFTNIFVRQR